MSPMPILKKLKRIDPNIQIKPLTSRDREQFVHRYRQRQAVIPWTVTKVRFSPNDILGCVDTISYDPKRIILDQTSVINEISHKRIEFKRMLINCPQTEAILVEIHGIDGYRIKRGNKWYANFTRHVIVTWVEQDKWERRDVPIDEPQPYGFDNSMTSECNTINDNKDGSKIKSKVMENKKHSVKVVK